MTTRAVKDYIFFCDLSIDYGLIDIGTYQLRQLALYDIMGVHRAVIDDLIPKYLVAEFYGEEEASTSDEGQRNYEGNIGKIISVRDQGDNLLYLYKTSSSGKYCNWVFHESDPDPRPSVPHGHGVEVGYYKLDPYCRLIYNVKHGLNKWVDKEDKKYIKALWNDNEFRRWALWSIKEFINSGPVGRNYNWLQIRGIANPHKLPRRRK